MALPTTSKSLIIQLGDGGETETFGFPCGANSQSITLTNNLGEDTLLDCADPDGVPATIVRWLESQDTSVSLSGRIAKESFATYRAWADAVDNGGVKNIRINMLNDEVGVGGYYALPAFLSTLEVGKEGKATMTVSLSISAAGQRVWTAATE